VTGIAGRVCVITGASRGIGEATARAMAAQGAAVVLASRNEERLAEMSRELRASWVRCDVTKMKDVQALQSHVETKHGRCDVLVNNAGVPGGGRFEDLSLERIRAVAETNLLSVLTVTKTFLPMLVASGGHVVNVASLAGRYALPGASVYTASKHGVVAFSEALHQELRPRGVMVTVVNPGLVATEGFFPADSPLWRDPLVRPFIMKPERIARTIVDVVRRRRGPEVSVPRWLAAPQAVRVLAPALYRAAMTRIAARRMEKARAPEE
jgi:short-subunit dehydrogenase